MSVLSFPRIYFNGYMMWDPPTANNNDYSTIYDPANADLDWAYLANQVPSITRSNFQETFRAWAIKPLKDVCPQPDSPSDTCPEVVNPDSECPPIAPSTEYHMGTRWDYFGGGGAGFLDYTAADPTYTKRTLTTGGDTAYLNPAHPEDAILNKPVVLQGNVFGDRASMARLVNINSISPFCSQIFFSKFMVGDEATHISGPREVRMFSRAFMAPRNLDNALIIAGAIGVIFQTTISFESLEIVNGGSSDLLSHFQQTMRSSKGLMIRFSTYNTLYYQNGIYNDNPQTPRTACELSKLWQDGKVFINPAYSRVAGVLGVWKEGELSSVPGGRQLVPVRKITPVNLPQKHEMQTRPGSFVGVAGKAAVVFGQDAAAASTSSGPPPFPQGTAWAEVDLANRLISLDMMNTILEWKLDKLSNDGEKFDYGTIQVGVETPSGFQKLGAFDYSQYNLASYLKQSGLIDVRFDPSAASVDVENWLKQGGLALQVQQDNKYESFLSERLLTADTDDRGIYVDQGRTAEIAVQVRYMNGPPPPNTYLYVVQYFPFPLRAGSGVLMPFPAPDAPWVPNTPVCEQTPNPKTPYITFMDGDVLPVKVSGTQTWGEAIVRISPEHPGFPNIVFYPFQDSNHPPTPPAAQPAITFGFGQDMEFDPSHLLIGNAGYSAVRVMPFDTSPLDGRISPLVDFVDRWNGTGAYSGQPKYNRELTWNWVYGNILYLYDMLFPVMDRWMPLHSLERVEGSIDQLVVMIQEGWVEESTLYMPVTRDLSAAKRLILETWGDLVIRKYPQTPLPTLAPPT